MNDEYGAGYEVGWMAGLERAAAAAMAVPEPEPGQDLDKAEVAGAAGAASRIEALLRQPAPSPYGKTT